MSSVYSTRFMSAHSTAGASYTVPAGYVAVIRCVTLVNTGASGAVNLTLYNATTGDFILSLEAIEILGPNAGSSPVIDMRYVANPGDVLQLGLQANAHGTVSGYLLPSQ